MKKISILFSILILAISCSDKNSSVNKDNVEHKSKIDISGHTFFKVTESDSGRVLYKPCGANIEKYIIYQDSIFHNLGQEYFTMKIKSISNIGDNITYKTAYKYNNEFPDGGESLIKIISIDKNKKFWKINNEIFIDSIFSKNLKTIKELPCDDDCYDCPLKTIVKEECKLNNLSNQFNLTLLTEYDKSSDDNSNLWKANIIIKLKNNSTIENIEFIPNSWSYFTSIQCNIISVADYNFDELDDFTIMSDVGGNSGPIFSYFFQNKENKFLKDKTFEFQDGPLPDKVDAKSKCLTFGSIVYKLQDNKFQAIP